MEDTRELLLQLLKKDLSFNLEKELLAVEQERSRILQDMYDGLFNKYKLTSSLLLERQEFCEPQYSQVSVKRKSNEVDCISNSFINKRKPNHIKIVEAQPFLGQMEDVLLTKLITFTDTRTKASITTWFFKDERVFRVQRLHMVKILSSHIVRGLSVCKLSTENKKLFIDQAMSAFGLKVPQATFFNVDSNLRDSISVVAGFADIGKALSEFME